MVDIVIINWNSGNMLQQCVHSILLPTNEALLNTVFIIDNQSADNSILLLPQHPKIKIIQNTENLGFAKACNQGFALATAPFVLLLNPDTRLFETSLSDCCSFMQSRPDVDIAGCQLLNEDGSISKSCARFPTVMHMCFDAIGLSKNSTPYVYPRHPHDRLGPC
jgi:GT2 family glycosyltransferase